jgi:hypothetical protein
MICFSFSLSTMPVAMILGVEAVALVLRETRVDVDDDDGLAAARDTRLDGLLAVVVVVVVILVFAAAGGGFTGSVFAAIDLLSSSSSSDDELPSFKLALLLSSFSELDDLAL